MINEDLNVKATEIESPKAMPDKKAMHSGRDGFSTKTIHMLRDRAGNVCSHPGCHVHTHGSKAELDGVFSVGVACHIKAAAPGGPRYDPDQSPEQRKHYVNGIWMCQTHSRLIDADDSRYSVEVLEEWKRLAELRANDMVNKRAFTESELSNAARTESVALLEQLVNRIGPLTSTSAKADIVGKWNLSTAQQLAERALNNADWSALIPEPQQPVTHYFENEYYLHLRDRERIVLAYSTKERDAEYHACSPHMSFFEFEKTSEGWNMIAEGIGVFWGGSWGNPPEIKLLPISHETFGVFMEDGGGNQGWFNMRQSLHIKMGDTFKLVLDLVVGQCAPDDRGWSSKLRIIDRPNGYYDIEVTRSGDNGPEDLQMLDTIENGYATICDSNGKICSHDVFKFDGRQYRRDIAIQ
ncbi:hypothetical protein [Pseudomonas leptonychotis]|uniref:hypothetical protein n=1 Tax=Pseudomonas leptonychotis TaxID=2448482 RepID=UPI00387002DD